MVSLQGKNRKTTPVGGNTFRPFIWSIRLSSHVPPVIVNDESIVFVENGRGFYNYTILVFIIEIPLEEGVDEWIRVDSNTVQPTTYDTSRILDIFRKSINPLAIALLSVHAE